MCSILVSQRFVVMIWVTFSPLTSPKGICIKSYCFHRSRWFGLNMNNCINLSNYKCGSYSKLDILVEWSTCCCCIQLVSDSVMWSTFIMQRFCVGKVYIFTVFKHNRHAAWCMFYFYLPPFPERRAALNRIVYDLFPKLIFLHRIGVSSAFCSAFSRGAGTFLRNPSEYL